MEILVTLEQRVVSLVELVKRLQVENGGLREESLRLREQLEHFEHSLLSRDQHAEERSHELARAKVVVDELIRTIDLVVDNSLVHETAKLETPS